MVSPWQAGAWQAPDASAQPLSAAGICWVAAHGGAGASMLASVVGGTDIGCRWPDATRDEPARIFLVARTHVTGLRAAARALNAVREGRHPAGMKLIGVALVADLPGRLPRSLSKQILGLEAGVPVRRIPWIPQWRLGRNPDNLPRPVLKLGELVEASRQRSTR